MHQGRLIRHAATLLLLALFSGAAGAQPPTIVGQTRRSAIQDWKARFEAGQESLRQKDFKKAHGIADALLREMIARIESGPTAGAVLGQTVLLRALAETGLGRTKEATWDWYAAVAVDPEIDQERLAPYGETGAALWAAVTAVPELPQPKASTDPATPSDEQVSRPVKIAGVAPKFPRGTSNACREGTIAVASLIDEQGDVRRPTMLDAPGGPVLTLAALEALKTWKFRPARYQGRPVKVYYTLTVRFSLGICRNPAAVPQRKGRP